MRVKRRVRRIREQAQNIFERIVPNPTEKSIVKRTVKLIEDRFGKDRVLVKKNHGNAMRRSEPDLTISIPCGEVHTRTRVAEDSVTIVAEMKRPGQKARPDQLSRLQRYARAGIRGGVFDNAEDVLRLCIEVQTAREKLLAYRNRY